MPLVALRKQRITLHEAIVGKTVGVSNRRPCRQSPRVFTYNALGNESREKVSNLPPPPTVFPPPAVAAVYALQSIG